jgi:competence ComEA-like helix-hairpin-helix protein
MFDLERAEKYIIAFLTLTLLLGVGVIAYNKSRPAAKIRIEKFSVGKTASGPRISNGGAADASRATAAGRININEAGSEELMRLKGIGKVLASRIVERRSSKGLFISKEDIKDVKGIGPALYERIKDDITVE